MLLNSSSYTIRHLLFITVSICVLTAHAEQTNTSNIDNDERMLIVLSAPSAGDPYYSNVYKEILEYQAAYAKAVIGKDNIVIIGDRAAIQILGKELPKDILLEANLRDIWMRDFTTVNPYQPVQFRYSAAAMAGNETDAQWVQSGFTKYLKKQNITYQKSDLILDGGNAVENYHGKVVVTDRFLQDNKLNKAEAIAKLKILLDANQVAVIPSDDPEGLAHADGMLMFVDENTIVVNRYEEPFRSSVLNELRTAFHEIKIVEIDVEFDTEIWDEDFASACGIYTNALITKNYIYLPLYDSQLDESATKTVQQHTDKQVVPIDAGKVCYMGGSVRCLGWQLTGENALKIIQSARDD